MLRKYTEKSNIKVLVSKYVKEILEEDTKHFNIPKYDLCNRILIKFFLRTDTNFSRLTPFEEKEYLQFSLQKDNIPRYIELKKLMKEKTESEMIREIFVSYTTLPPFLREINLFEEKIVFLITAKKEYKKLKLYTDEGIIEGKINSLKRNEINNYLEVEINSKKYYISRVEIIN
ncbi:DeoR family transcriptional regulator [Fusobacterium polymorphum]|uniref:DeoR family transcriptional regulator n=1 Tax=Fusobacterium nucleatum subsp. polymorphum TaxID=76857 RepID=A0A1Z3CIF4_FUSNP|nr:DeoR family transcriptional regulator [Fusobacterium polymorphum]ASC03205.1 DeoR family transcriptional regulator [Fusobacterium polymorphum]